MAVTLADEKLITDLLQKVETINEKLNAAPALLPEVPVTEERAAELYGVHPATFKNLRAAGVLKGYKFTGGKKAYYFISEINAALRGQTAVQ